MATCDRILHVPLASQHNGDLPVPIYPCPSRFVLSYRFSVAKYEISSLLITAVMNTYVVLAFAVDFLQCLFVSFSVD